MVRLQRFALAALSLVLMLALTFASTAALQRSASTPAKVVGTPVSLGEIVVTAERSAPTNALNQDDILWLARVIYSETKKPHEQELVAWVVRNRVETEYRGRDTYKEVVLDPYQFSAFNRNSPKRSQYASLDWSAKAPGFQTALSIAAKVASCEPTARPFSETTRHFFSRQSMVGGRTPAWAVNKRPVKLDRFVEADRFRFYDRVS
jgi:hypothetical protein